jgi:integrase
MNGLGGRRRRLDIRGRRDGRKSVPLEARGIGPHDLRRTCAKLCRAAGGELEQTQILLGHASVQTTERYLGTKQDLVNAPNERSS